MILNPGNDYLVLRRDRTKYDHFGLRLHSVHQFQIVL